LRDRTIENRRRKLDSRDVRELLLGPIDPSAGRYVNCPPQRKWGEMAGAISDEMFEALVPSAP
jgi:hypothetical protein